jgi:hypothetical protein
MGWVVNATPRPLCPRERTGTHCIRGWVGPRAGLDGCGKPQPIGIRSPDRPGSSESKKKKKNPRIRVGEKKVTRMLLFAEMLRRVTEQNVFPNILLSSSAWKMEPPVPPKHWRLYIKWGHIVPRDMKYVGICYKYVRLEPRCILMFYVGLGGFLSGSVCPNTHLIRGSSKFVFML